MGCYGDSLQHRLHIRMNYSSILLQADSREVFTLMKSQRRTLFSTLVWELHAPRWPGARAGPDESEILGPPAPAPRSSALQGQPGRLSGYHASPAALHSAHELQKPPRTPPASRLEELPQKRIHNAVGGERRTLHTFEGRRTAKNGGLSRADIN